MTFFQITAILFALFMTFSVSIQSKKQVLSAVEASFWYSLWGLFMVFAAFPELLIDIVDLLHFSRVFDLLVVLAFMILTVLVFSGYFEQRSLHRKLEKFVREEALRRVIKN